jgi:hypothetical protein
MCWITLRIELVAISSLHGHASPVSSWYCPSPRVLIRRFSADVRAKYSGGGGIVNVAAVAGAPAKGPLDGKNASEGLPRPPDVV